MRIAVLGAGAIGLYYGARLALAGHDVRFLVRSDFDALRARGITLHVQGVTQSVAPVAAFRSSEDIGPVDLVLVTLKATANDSLAKLLPPLVRSGTLVVTLQNGLGNEQRIAEIVGDRDLLGGLCFIACMRTGPGEVLCLHPGSISLGEFTRSPGDRTRAVARELVNAGVECHVVPDLVEARWRKLVWNIPFNGLSIATGGLTTDVLCADPMLAREVKALMSEVRGAAGALGYAITQEFAEEQFDVTPPMGPYRPSSLVDYLAGRPVEVEAIWGEPLRQALAAGAQVPRLCLLHALLTRLTRRA